MLLGGNCDVEQDDMSLGGNCDFEHDDMSLGGNCDFEQDDMSPGGNCDFEQDDMLLVDGNSIFAQSDGLVIVYDLMQGDGWSVGGPGHGRVLPALHDFGDLSSPSFPSSLSLSVFLS